MNKVFTNAEGITKENPKVAHAITKQNKEPYMTDTSKISRCFNTHVHSRTLTFKFILMTPPFLTLFKVFFKGHFVKQLVYFWLRVVDECDTTLVASLRSYN